MKKEPFLFAGISAGLKESKKKDLGIVFCNQPCVAAGVFTKNCYPAPHVLYARNLLPASNIQAIVVNSGQSLAGTGAKGVIANEQMINEVAKILQLHQSAVLSSSTGVIGKIPSLELIKKALPRLQKELSPNFHSFAEAILTTDIKTKISRVVFGDYGEKYFVLGICKGSGMIAPNMATMLSYVFTNYPFNEQELQKITSQIAEKSFNCVSIDSDTSTSDSFFLLSSSSYTKPQTKKIVAVENILWVAKDLAKQIAADGEGLEHMIELKVQRAPSKKLAKNVLHKILNSPLVKCCINGEDANWGRILMALGNGLAATNEADFFPATIKIQGITIFDKQQPVNFDEKLLQRKMQNFQIFLLVDLLVGKHQLTGWGCDLSKEYITINADYRT